MNTFSAALLILLLSLPVSAPVSAGNQVNAGIFEQRLSFLLDQNDNCTPEKRVAACTEEVIQQRVAWACRLIETYGRSSLPEINLMRFSCCTEANYVWINDFQPKMIQHPIKASLNGKDLSGSVDKNGKKLFVEFARAAQEKPSGSWVEYLWPKAGMDGGAPKKSWVKKCKVPAGPSPEEPAVEWVVGSGTWK